MHIHRLLVLTAVGLVTLPILARGEITYPRGTTLEEAWLHPPRISADEAIGLLTDRLLARHRPGSEIEIGAAELEAYKFLVGDPRRALAEPPVQAGMRRYGGEIAPETMTPDQRIFFEGLSLSLSTALGLPALSQPGLCVRQRTLFETTKYKYDVGWNEIEVWGLTAFGHNLEYGINHSDLVYGVFPWGLRMSWWDGLQCVLDEPSNEEELRACGRTKEWKIHGASEIRLSSAYEHVVPGVAQASLPYAGALVSGSADQFRTHYQTRPATDPTWLLGPSNSTPPSRVSPTDDCVGLDPWCDMGVAVDYVYQFSQVIAWFPNVILNASYNNPVPRKHEIYRYSGKGDGNPHGLGTWSLTRSFSRFHEPVTSCP